MLIKFNEKNVLFGKDLSEVASLKWSACATSCVYFHSFPLPALRRFLSRLLFIALVFLQG